nr:interactor of constitutive active ROPs 1-like [Aegilops tauschii subsp. strangulata]
MEEDFGGRVAEAQDWFRQAQDELKAARAELANREVELAMKLADIEKAQETAKRLADEAEAVRSHHEAALKTQEEDLAEREERLATTLRGKDEEVDKLVLQRTQELERRHQEALNALAQAHAGKVKELEEQALKLAQEKHMLNGALTVAQGEIISKSGELSEANASIRDLKLKLGELEETLLIRLQRYEH